MAPALIDGEPPSAPAPPKLAAGAGDRLRGFARPPPSWRCSSCSRSRACSSGACCAAPTTARRRRSRPRRETTTADQHADDAETDLRDAGGRSRPRPPEPSRARAAGGRHRRGWARGRARRLGRERRADGHAGRNAPLRRQPAFAPRGRARLSSTAAPSTSSAARTRGHAERRDRPRRPRLAPGHVRGHFVEPLAGAGYAQAGNSLVLVGGWTGEQYATAVLRFTLPDKADVVARLPEATRDPAVTMRGDTVYVAGGRTESGFEQRRLRGRPRRRHRLGRRPAAACGVRRSARARRGQALPARRQGRRRPGAHDREHRPGHGHDRERRHDAAPARGRRRRPRGGATYLLGGTRPTAITRVEVR